MSDGARRYDRAAHVLGVLQERGQTLAVAESLTGGEVCSDLVAVPGASRVLRGGVVAYAGDLKVSLLGVDADLLDGVGSVHAEVARQMAQGVLTLTGATWGVATTGVAGPDPQDGVPPGRVYLSVAGPCPVAMELHLSGSRADIRAGAAVAAVELLEQAVSGQAAPPD